MVSLSRISLEMAQLMMAEAHRPAARPPATTACAWLHVVVDRAWNGAQSPAVWPNPRRRAPPEHRAYVLGRRLLHAGGGRGGVRAHGRGGRGHPRRHAGGLLQPAHPLHGGRGALRDGARVPPCWPALHATPAGPRPAPGNVACDYVIDDRLLEMGWASRRSTSATCTTPNLRGLGAEEIYDRIVRDLRRMRKLGKARGMNGGAPDMLDDGSHGAGRWAGGGVDLHAFYRRALAEATAARAGRSYCRARWPRSSPARPAATWSRCAWWVATPRPTTWAACSPRR